jgi:flagellar hook-basal body complex protein FliE
MIDKIGGVAAGGMGVPRVATGTDVAQANFTNVLASLAANAVESVKTAEQASVAGIRGEMPVQEVVSSVMGAERSLHTAIAVRDKVVAAYLEISRMQI